MKKNYANEKVHEWLLEILPSLRRSAETQFYDLDIESIVQDSIVIVLLKIKSGDFKIEEATSETDGVDIMEEIEIRNKAKIYRYLSSLIKWRAIDAYRKLKTFQFIEFNEEDHQSHEDEDEDEDEDIEKNLGIMYELIPQLPKIQRVVVLEKLKGKTTSEIAQLLDIKNASVRSSWRHARYRLSSMMDQSEQADLGVN